MSTQITEPPKVARTGILSLLHQAHRHAGRASFPPSPFMKVIAQHPPENKCPFVLYPHASPAFCPWPACPASCSKLCQKDAGCCAVQLQGASHTQTTPVSRHCAGPAQWPRRGQDLFVLPPYNDCQPLSYRKQNRTNKSLTGPDGASQVLTFYSQSWPSSCHSLIHWDRSVDTVLLFPLPAFPSRGFAFQLKTKQSQTRIKPQIFPNF